MTLACEQTGSGSIDCHFLLSTIYKEKEDGSLNRKG